MLPSSTSAFWWPGASNFGPDATTSLHELESLREPLYQLALAKHGDYVLSESVVDSEGELVVYYEDVLRLTREHRKRLDQQSHHFGLRPPSP